MLTLHTLGSVYVASEHGVALGGAVAQRRLLALLVVLAVAGERGVSRDKLVSLFWPEGDPDKARHSLTQSLYHTRKALLADDLFIGTGDVRINPQRLHSDVREMEEAVAAGDLERAAGLYKGPFLDGFFLTGSREFEEWASAQRARLAGLACTTLDRLADAAEASSDMASAVEWRKRRFALDPLDSAAAVRLMATMAASGDPAGALRQAHVHEILLRQQLDLAPDPAVSALVRRLRSVDQKGDANRSSSGVRFVPAAMSAGVATLSSSPPSPAPTDVSATDPPRTELDGADPPRRPPARPTGRVLLASLAAAAAVAVAGALIFLPERREERLGGSIASRAPRIIVAPFRVAGSDPSLGYLRDGMVELLSTRLAGDSVAPAVDPGAVLAAWRVADAGNLTERDIAARAARRLGATHAVVGSVVGTPAKLVLSAALISAADMSVRSQTSVEGPGDSLTALIDQLAARLLAAQAGEGERLSEYVTPSLPALRAFLAGQAAYREERYTDAVHHYEYALRRDSSFALAALQLALAADRLNDAEQHDRALALAWAARDELTERDRSHLEAFAGPRYPAPSSEAEQLAAWQRAVALAPDRADVWMELGERFFYYGAVLGAADAHRRAAAAFRRALSLEPNLVAPRRLLILIAARSGDSTALARLTSRAALRDSVGDLAPFVRWRVALTRSDDAELRRIRVGFPQLDDANLRAIAVSSQFDAVGIDDGERALRLRRVRTTRAATLVDVLLGQHSLAVARGRPVLALDVIEQLQELQPASRAYLRLRLLDALYAEGDRAAAIAAAAVLGRVVDVTRAPARGDAEWLADVCVLEQWRVANGETRSGAAAIERLRAGPLPRVLVPVSANPLTCAELLDATLAVATRAQAALARVMQLDSLMLGGPAVSDAGSYAHLVVARLYERLGERSRALAAIRRRPYLTGWPRYLIPALREEGRLAEAIGDTAGAITAYSAYLAARTAPEESLAAQVAAVRASLARLDARERSAPSR